MSHSPKESDFIDIHSHSEKEENGVFRIHNVFATDYKKIPSELPVSIGLHPWHINDNSISLLPEILQNSASLENCLAIGETGLDSLVQTPISTQITVFRKHIEIGIKENKPLIIHFVKAFPELLSLRKEYTNAAPWIIHGFNANPTIAAECLKHGIYLSLSQRLFRNPEKAEKIMKVVPVSMIFAETDEDSMSIQEIYDTIATFYGLSISALKKIIFENYRRCIKV